MAARYLRRSYDHPGFVSHPEMNPEGHTILIYEAWRLLGSRLPFDYERSFRIKCRQTPTRWSLQLAIRRVPTDGSVTCEINIRRLDNAPVDMGTDFWMRAPLVLVPTYTTVNLRAEGMFPNHQATKIIQFVPWNVLMYLGTIEIEVKMYFRVRRCHPYMMLVADPDQYTPPDASEEMDVVELPQMQ